MPRSDKTFQLRYCDQSIWACCGASRGQMVAWDTTLSQAICQAIGEFLREQGSNLLDDCVSA